MFFDTLRIKQWIADLKAEAAGEFIKRRDKRGWLAKFARSRWTFSTFNIAIGVVCFYNEQWIGLAIIVAIFIFNVIIDFWPELLLSKRAVLAYLSFSILVISFVIGVSQSSAYLKLATTADTLQLTDDVIQGNIIRSGERGVLMHLPSTNQIALVRWDKIREVIRTATRTVSAEPKK
jgi:hypothetical protein